MSPSSSSAPASRSWRRWRTKAVQPTRTLARFLPVIRREATDERNFVKKAVNWALRQIGKRSEPLRVKAIATAERIATIDSRSARWIAADALRELRSDAVRTRIARSTASASRPARGRARGA